MLIIVLGIVYTYHRLNSPELRLDSIPGYMFNNQYNQSHGSISVEHDYKLMVSITHVNTTRFTTRDFITADNHQPRVCISGFKMAT